jgi:flagellin
MNAQAINSNTNKDIGSSLEKLASGHSINKAADDSAGLAIADKLRTQASSLNQGIKNANSGVAMIQMADKAMDEQSNILSTVKTKLIQSATDSTTDDGRNSLKNDIQKLLTQFDNIATQTNYNGTNLLNEGKTFTFQVGENAGEDISATTMNASNTASLGGEKADAAIQGNDIAVIQYGGKAELTNTTAGDITIDLKNAAGSSVDIGTASGSTMDISGDLKTLGASTASDITIKANDTDTAEMLTTMSKNNANLTDNENGTYTLKKATATGTHNEINIADGNSIDITITKGNEFDVTAQADKAISLDASNLAASQSIHLDNAAEAVVGGALVDNIGEEQSKTLGGGDKNITLQGMDSITGAKESITDTRIEGTVQKLENTSTASAITFKANDEATRNALDAIAANTDNAIFKKTGSGSNTVYELAAATASGNTKVINLDNLDIDITITKSGTTGIGVKAENEEIKVTQNKNDQTLGIDNALDGIGGGGAGSLSKLKDLDTLTVDAANDFMKSIDKALTQLNENRSELGSTQVQLESAVRNQQVTVVSLNQAESIIRDTDYAAESANFNKLKIVSQAGMYAISQANAVQQNVQKLLQ